MAFKLVCEMCGHAHWYTMLPTTFPINCIVCGSRVDTILPETVLMKDAK